MFRRTEQAQAKSVGLRAMPADGAIEPWLAALGTLRGRPLELVECALAAVPQSGLTVAFEGRDVVAVEAGAAPSRRAAIIGHEVAHILLGHTAPEGDPSAPPVDLHQWFPDLDQRVVGRVLAARSCGHGTDEVAAEALGTAFAVELRMRELYGADGVSERLR